MNSERYAYLNRVPDWVAGYTTWLPERVVPVRRVGYTLKDLVQRGLIPEEDFEAFAKETCLADFAWRVLWADSDDRPDTESVANAVRYAEGIIVFIHGWGGSGEIWEELPALVVQRNPGLIALVPDVNGFGGTPFQADMPPLEKCNPPANMAAIEWWLALLEIRTPASSPRTRPFVFVGHSMGGATLFFLDENRWKPGEVGRIAAAPALLLNDRVRQGFYRALGAGIMLTRWNELIDKLAEELFATRLFHALGGQGSDRVHAEHQRIYKITPEGVLARTFAAMGRLEWWFEQEEWPHFQVMLGYKDRLVGLQPMLELLEAIHFDPAQIRVALGDHYFFSIGSNAESHERNRALLLDSVLAMHRELGEEGSG